MLVKFVSILLISVACHLQASSFEQPLHISFDESMQYNAYKHIFFYYPDHFPFWYNTFKRQYDLVNFKTASHSPEPRIPKRIHQIWLGSPVPEEFKALIYSWRKMHPDWQHYLWTDEIVSKFKLLNQDLFDAKTNYGEKSDILRYEILYNLGGVYADIDFECLKPLDVLHHCFDFYIGMQPLDTNIVQVGIGLIGAKPNHPILLKAMQEMKKRAHEDKIIWRTGPAFFTCRVLLDYLNNVNQLHERNVILPASYFYPRGYKKSRERETWDRPEAFAVHHWAGSWLKRPAFVSEIQHLVPEHLV